MAKRMKEERGGLRERLCSMLDVPAEALVRAPHVEICGRERLTLLGGGSIREYTGQCVRVECGRGELVILGKRLFCKAFSIGTLTVTGRICSVSFEEGEVSR